MFCEVTGFVASTALLLPVLGVRCCGSTDMVSNLGLVLSLTDLVP